MLLATARQGLDAMLGLSASDHKMSLPLCLFGPGSAVLYRGVEGKKNTPDWYSMGLHRGRTGQKSVREAGKTSGGSVRRYMTGSFFLHATTVRRLACQEALISVGRIG